MANTQSTQSTQSTVKIIGLRDVVGDLLHCPAGHHYEVWSELDGQDVRIWTSQLLSANSWTTGHPETERELTGTIHELRERARYDGENLAMTDAVRQAVAEVWGVVPRGASDVCAARKIRRAGNSLVVPVTDLADLLDVGQGDIVKVTLSRVE